MATSTETISTTQASPIALKWVPLPEPLPNPPPSLVTRTVDKLDSFPCRRCLSDGLMGETMHLLSYNPFPSDSKDSPYTGPGPIYVHAAGCAQYTSSEVPEQQRKRLVSLRGFDKDHMMMDVAVLRGDGLAERARTMLADKKVVYVHVHYTGPGCFAVRVDRAN